MIWSANHLAAVLALWAGAKLSLSADGSRKCSPGWCCIDFGLTKNRTNHPAPTAADDMASRIIMNFGNFMLDLKHTRFYASLLFSQTPGLLSVLSRLHSFLLLVQLFPSSKLSIYKLWHSTLWTASVFSKNPMFWRLSAEICSFPHDCSYTSLTVIHKVKIKYWDTGSSFKP